MTPSNEVSIIIRVNDSDAAKFGKVADKQRLMGEAAKAAAGDLGKLDAAQRSAAQSANQLTTAESRAAEKLDKKHTQAIIDDRARTQRMLDERVAAQLAYQRRIDALQAQAVLEDRARERQKTQQREVESARRVAIEAAALDKIGHLHTQAIIEDRARERARTLVVEREAAQQRAARMAALRNAGAGVLSYAGAGFGTNALGAGIVAAGSATYASATSIAFERAEQSIASVTGSLAGAQRQMQAVEFQAQRLGINILDLARLYGRFEAASKGTTLEGAKARDIFYAVAEAAQRLSLRGDEVEGVLRAIEQMMSKGKIQAEELRGQLGDRLPGAFNIMARAMGVSAGQLDKMLKAGEVASEEVLPKFAAELRKTFNTDINTRIETTISNFQRLLNEIRLTADAAGDKLNPALSATASRFADIIAFARDNNGAILTALFTQGAGSFARIDALAQQHAQQRAHGEIVREQIDDAVFNPQGLVDRAIRPGATRPFYGPGTPYVPEAIDLTAGVTPLDPERVAKLREELALMGEKSEVAKTLWQYSEGEFKNANATERAIALQVAALKDKQAAEKESAKERDQAEKEQTRERERELKVAMDLEEKDRERIRAQMIRNEILAAEVTLGAKLTRSAQQLVELDMARAEIGNRTLESELLRGHHLETIIESRQFYSKLFDSMERDAKRTTDNMSVFAERAAQNMQDTFADYLFNPFENGVRGMLNSFTDALHRMVAQAAAAQFFDTVMPRLTGSRVGAVDFVNQDPFGDVQYVGGKAGSVSSGAESKVIVNVANYGSSSAAQEEVSARMSPEGLIIDVVLRDITQGGRVSKALAARGLPMRPTVRY